MFRRKLSLLSSQKSSGGDPPLMYQSVKRHWAMRGTGPISFLETEAGDALDSNNERKMNVLGSKEQTSWLIIIRISYLIPESKNWQSETKTAFLEIGNVKSLWNHLYAFSRKKFGNENSSKDSPTSSNSKEIEISFHSVVSYILKYHSILIADCVLEISP